MNELMLSNIYNSCDIENQLCYPPGKGSDSVPTATGDSETTATVDDEEQSETRYGVFHHSCPVPSLRIFILCHVEMGDCNN